MTNADVLGAAAQRLSRVREQIESAARRARRDATEISLIAVSKTRSTEQIAELLAAGQQDFGESRIQETEQKWPALRQAHPRARLHLIGRLQSNKAAEAVNLFDTIHSLDRSSLLNALVAAAAKVQRWPAVYVQVNIGEEPQKGGVAIADLPRFLDEVRASPLPLAGLMAIPPQGLEPAPYFALLAKLARRHDVTGLSMGMSADYPTAVALGATVIRVGTALFED